MPPNRRDYQYGFSTAHPGAMYNSHSRERKAKTMVTVLQDYFSVDLKSLTLLDVGTSTGIIVNYLSRYFGKVVAIDIDRPAVMYAGKNFSKKNLVFSVADSQHICLPDETMDVIICAHIYEHVPSAVRLMDEIHRVLKPNGICYFAAGNRLQLIEPHYRLPLLSALPRPLAHIFFRLAGKGSRYYEKHFTYWGLKKLVRKFDRIDYTGKIIDRPENFNATYMLRPGSRKKRLAEYVVRYAYWLCPGYIWLLKKREPVGKKIR